MTVEPHSEGQGTQYLSVAVKGPVPELTFVLPVFNDRESLELLVYELSQLPFASSLVVVEDGTDCLGGMNWNAGQFRSIHHIRLKRNMGHQRAIMLGIAWAAEHAGSGDALVVMDSDGEDDPQCVPALWEGLQDRKRKCIVFSSRKRRSESLTFKLGYAIYKVLFKGLTGQSIEFGNFCIIPMPLASRVSSVSEGWNHFASSVIKAKLPHFCIPWDRRRRLQGVSTMNLNALVIHGLSAISVFAETAAVRLLVSGLLLVPLFLAVILVVFSIRVFTEMAIPGWSSSIILGTTTLLFQTLTVILMSGLSILSSRNGSTFIPARDYHWFIQTVEVISE